MPCELQSCDQCLPSWVKNVDTINIPAVLSEPNLPSPPQCCMLTYIAGAQVGSFYGQVADTLYWLIISCLAAHNLSCVKA